MVITDKDILKSMDAGILTVEELSRHLLRNYSAYQLAAELARDILEEREIKTALKPVVVTPQQLTTFFKIQGYRFVNGELVPETRGKKPSEL